MLPAQPQRRVPVRILATICVLLCSAVGSLIAVLALDTSSMPAISAIPLRTPYARQGALKIERVALPASVPRYGRVEMTVELSAAYDNPFDSSDVALDARVTTPAGKTLDVPGFFHQDYTRELKNGNEQLTPRGEPSWRIRFTPQETGAHTAVVTLRDRSGAVRHPNVRFTVAGKSAATNKPAPATGFVRLSRRDGRYFAFDNGQHYFPIGANVCWAGGRGSFDYDDWFPAYARAGCNYARLWLSPQWTTFALERAGKTEEGKGMGQFDLANAWRIDYVLGLAEAQGLYLMLCIDSYNILQPSKGAYGIWDETPHNAANGGPLARPTDFWSDAAMQRFYRDKLRYLVARYGHSRHVLAWEFWNEVDGTQGYATAPVRDWHARMATHLRAIDPHKHLITTSYAGSDGDPAVDRLPQLDYVQTHHYGSPDLARTLAHQQARKAAYGKPHYVGEIGADAGGPRREDDPQGLQIHDPLWVSVATGGAGAAQPWWWDNLIHPNNLYGLFTPVARFVRDIKWDEEKMQPVEPRLLWRQTPSPLPRRDLVLEGGPVSWEISAYNRPRTVRVDRSGAQGDLPLAGIQHGVRNHLNKHNPVTLETDFPWPVRFEVEVGDVSGYGGAALKISLDGAVALQKDFSDPDDNENPQTLRQYAGRYGIEIPAGRHTLIVENTGNDWFMAGFRFRDATERTAPPLVAWAMAGTTTGVAWVRVEDRTWRRVIALKEPVAPAPPSVLVLPKVAPGRWRAEVWDTWSGAVLQSQTVTVPATGAAAGQARVPLPAIEKDVAIKLRRF